MKTAGIDLLPGEEIVLECEGALLTSQRVFTNWHEKRKSRSDIPREVLLRDVSSFEKVSGGQESRMKLALRALAAGGILVLVQMAFSGLFSWNRLFEAVVFAASAIAVIVGLYLAFSSITRVKPHTTIVFQVPGGNDMLVYFPGKENKDADQFTRQFARTKRGM